MWTEYQDLNDELETANSLLDSSELTEDEFTNQLEDLQDELDTLQKEYNLLTRQKEAVQGSYDEAVDTISDYEIAQANISTYNIFLNYFRQVIVAHGGFEGWTQAEYERALGYAEDTGSSSFVTVVEYAWNNTDIPPATRVTDVVEAIVSGINANL